jgi:hypothetical protein
MSFCNKPDLQAGKQVNGRSHPRRWGEFGPPNLISFLKQVGLQPLSLRRPTARQAAANWPVEHGVILANGARANFPFHAEPCTIRLPRASSIAHSIKPRAGIRHGSFCRDGLSKAIIFFFY